MNRLKSEWVLLAAMLALVGIVFWQILTVMTEAGMASGGAFDNAATYPKGIAIILFILVMIRATTRIINKKNENKDEVGVNIFSRKPLILILIFGLYLFGLKTLGYHLSTAPFLIATLYLGGERSWKSMISMGVVTSFVISFIFEVLLKIVLPGGMFHINIPW